MEGIELSPINTTLDTSVYVKEYNAEFNKKVLPVSIVFGLTASVGLIANALVMYIYGFRYKRCNFKYFFFTLGLINLLQCTIMLPTQIGKRHYWFNFPTSWLCRTSAYVFGYTIIHCYFVLFLIALDRFRKVCRPYDWQIQANTARNLSIITSIASFILATPPGVSINNHALEVHGAILNAFVIFHRGSFSMICALFPIIYGVRDNSFRNIVREMLVKDKGSNQEQKLETCA
ncbi:hypothetical protein DPMN_052426 [Dreissena polymorpha]|uniref:G-protein coupled receptors family 1 profile domain-containing protein n=1 Tax=Dreissena polymorpha TaxID=45954 RepID=A0A9D4CJN9_DREPO|nr:hypothetical protein DPMN_052426 [Dreissena polymorpha]